MPTSDTPQHEDAVLGEIVHQLADTAPPPPAWDRIETATRFPVRHERTWPQFAAAAAAIAALVVGGLFWLTRPDDQDEIPAEPPTETIAPVDDFGAWVDDATTVDAQLCFSRTVDALVDEHEAALIEASTTQPSLSLPVQERIAVRRSTIGPLDALVRYPDTPATIRDDLRAVVEAHEAAEVGQFDAAGTVDAESAEELAATSDAVRAASPALDPDPARCWFERPTGLDAVASLVVNERPIVAARCLSLAQFDHTIEVLGVDPDALDLAIEAQRSLTRWYDPIPAVLVELDRAVVDAEFVADPAAAVAAARADIDPSDLGAEACDAAFAGASRPDLDRTSTNPSPGG